MILLLAQRYDQYGRPITPSEPWTFYGVVVVIAVVVLAFLLAAMLSAISLRLAGQWLALTRPNFKTAFFLCLLTNFVWAIVTYSSLAPMFFGLAQINQGRGREFGEFQIFQQITGFLTPVFGLMLMAGSVAFHGGIFSLRLRMPDETALPFWKGTLLATVYLSTTVALCILCSVVAIFLVTAVLA